MTEDHPTRADHDLPDATTTDYTELRRRLRAKRRSIQHQRHSDASQKVGEQIIDHCRRLGLHLAPGRLGIYVPSDGEISPHHIGRAFSDFGWSVWLPVVGTGGAMTFSPVTDESEFVINRFGIEEPADRDESCGAHELDIVVIPCVAVDQFGNRLGMGAGFYDRALAERPPSDRTRDTGSRPLRIGIAFESQLVTRLIPRPWDATLDVVVTEERVIVVGGSNPIDEYSPSTLPDD